MAKKPVVSITENDEFSSNVSFRNQQMATEQEQVDSRPSSLSFVHPDHRMSMLTHSEQSSSKISDKDLATPIQSK